MSEPELAAIVAAVNFVVAGVNLGVGVVNRRNARRNLELSRQTLEDALDLRRHATHVTEQARRLAELESRTRNGA